MEGVNNLWHIAPDVYERAQNELKAGNLYAKSKKAPYILLEAGDIDKRRVVDQYQRCKVPGYEVSRVEVIFNKTLVQLFEAKIQALEQRHDNAAFSPRWRAETKDKSQKEIRDRVDYTLTAEVSKYAVANRHVKILPMFHGTNKKLFDSIFRTGFDNLASTDAGYFGKGLYNTTYAEYAWRVYSTGGLLFNWVAFYSAFPVVKEDMKSLIGSAKHQNYDAHYALVKPMDPSNPKEKVYLPIGLHDKVTFDELVVFESAQVLPRYVVTLGPVGLKLQELPAAPKANKKNLLQAMSVLWKKGHPNLQGPLKKKMDEVKKVADTDPDLTKEEEWLQDQIQVILANEADEDQDIPNVLKEQIVNVLNIGGKSDPILGEAPASPPPQKEQKEVPVSVDSVYAQGMQLLAQNQATEAFLLFKQAADRHHHAASQYQVGQCYKMGNGVAPSYPLAIAYSQQAAAQHHPDALDYVGHCYLNGYTLPKDPVKAVACFREAADLGNVSSMHYMSVCSQDPNEIQKYLKILADGGHGESQWKMSLFAKQAKNYSEAFAYGLKAADNGVADAQDYVGHCFRNGLSTAKDPVRAVFYFKKAAVQDNLSSIEYLGICSTEGFGGMVKDDHVAYQYFFKAAEKGRPHSQFYVGIFSRDGRGTDKNPVRARQFLEAAKALGQAGAEEALNTL